MSTSKREESEGLWRVRVQVAEAVTAGWGEIPQRPVSLHLLPLSALLLKSNARGIARQSRAGEIGTSTQKCSVGDSSLRREAGVSVCLATVA